MERLRKSKSTATAQFASADGATRFEPSLATDAAATAIVENATVMATTPESTTQPVADTSPAPEDTTSADFTSRLLEAKKRVRDNQQRRN
jgi:hypothetical protein